MGKKNARRPGSSKENSSEQGGLSDQQTFGFKRKDIIDAGHQQLKTLNRLDIELNEILANVLKEENRQRLLMQSLLKLIDKNKEQFFSADEINDAEEDWAGIMSNNRKDKDSSFLRNNSSVKSLKIVTKPSSRDGPPSPSEPSPSNRGGMSQSAKLPAPFSSGNSILNAGKRSCYYFCALMVCSRVHATASDYTLTLPPVTD
jgi:hypothetical protein